MTIFGLIEAMGNILKTSNKASCASKVPRLPSDHARRRSGRRRDGRRTTTKARCGSSRSAASAAPTSRFSPRRRRRAPTTTPTSCCTRRASSSACRSRRGCRCRSAERRARERAVGRVVGAIRCGCVLRLGGVCRSAAADRGRRITPPRAPRCGGTQCRRRRAPGRRRERRRGGRGQAPGRTASGTVVPSLRPRGRRCRRGPPSGDAWPRRRGQGVRRFLARARAKFNALRTTWTWTTCPLGQLFTHPFAPARHARHARRDEAAHAAPTPFVAEWPTTCWAELTVRATRTCSTRTAPFSWPRKCTRSSKTSFGRRHAAATGHWPSSSIWSKTTARETGVIKDFTKPPYRDRWLDLRQAFVNGVL